MPDRIPIDGNAVRPTKRFVHPPRTPIKRSVSLAYRMWILLVDDQPLLLLLLNFYAANLELCLGECAIKATGACCG